MASELSREQFMESVRKLLSGEPGFITASDAVLAHDAALREQLREAIKERDMHYHTVLVCRSAMKEWRQRVEELEHTLKLSAGYQFIGTDDAGTPFYKRDDQLTALMARCEVAEKYKKWYIEGQVAANAAGLICSNAEAITELDKQLAACEQRIKELEQK